MSHAYVFSVILCSETFLFFMQACSHVFSVNYVNARTIMRKELIAKRFQLLSQKIPGTKRVERGFSTHARARSHRAMVCGARARGDFGKRAFLDTLTVSGECMHGI